MQVLLHADTNIENHGAIALHVETRVKAALIRFGGRITRVEGHLSDVNGPLRDTPDDIHCTLEARVVGTENVVVKGQAGTVHQAVDDAVHKLQRAVGTALAKQDHRGRRPGSLAPR